MSKQRRATKPENVQDEPESFYSWDGDVLILNILGTPNAKRDTIGKVKANQLKISVTADPINGKATDHMVKYLSRVFDVKRSDIEVVYGRMNVNKQLRIKSPKKLIEGIEEKRK